MAMTQMKGHDDSQPMCIRLYGVGISAQRGSVNREVARPSADFGCGEVAGGLKGSRAQSRPWGVWIFDYEGPAAD